MQSIRKWFYRPKRDDKSLLAQFFYADEALNIITNELDTFDGRKDPERCTALVNQLRQCQDKVLTITNAIMDALIGNERANRDFRVKFPEDVLQDNLGGQLWFGAECLAAGSSIMNRDAESNSMRPLAKAVTKSLDTVRNLIRETCLRSNTPNAPIQLDGNELVTEMLLESLKIFDRLLAEFELVYVSAMVPVKSAHEYELQELIGVLFTETVQRALRMQLITQEMIDSCDPALMFTIPRLAIVSGLLIFRTGPLTLDTKQLSTMFRPFRTLLRKIRQLLFTLTTSELYRLERILCDNEQIFDVHAQITNAPAHTNNDDFERFYIGATTTNNNSKQSVFGPNNDSNNNSNNSGDDESSGLEDDDSFGIWESRQKYKSSDDLLHRLFVCIAGVADQLQTNFASDLRNILKAVFLINSSPPDDETTTPTTQLDDDDDDDDVDLDQENDDDDVVVDVDEFPVVTAQEAVLYDANMYVELGGATSGTVAASVMMSPPIWIPDVEAPRCMSCQCQFTVMKRRHHCRHCGKVFCGRCSANSVALPKFGHHKPVRVCNKCFLYNLTPFTM